MKTDEAHLLQSLCAIKAPEEMRRVLGDLLTRSEYNALLKRWSILCLLRDGVSQRETARRIGGSLCNVTRGARLLRDPACASATLMARLEKSSPNPPA